MTYAKNSSYVKKRHSDSIAILKCRLNRANLKKTAMTITFSN